MYDRLAELPIAPAVIRPIALLLALAAVLAALGGCRSAYYGAWEALGREKRDLLRNDVKEVRNDQQAAAKQFREALDVLRELSDYQGGELEKLYNRLSARSEDASGRAQEVRDKINEIDRVAGDLFEEWEVELEEITSTELRARSRERLAETRFAYNQLEKSLRTAADRMDPVLTRLNDQVLFLKHNLNARVVEGLGPTAANLEGDIQLLIADLEASIREAERFIRTID